jgi:hypothetical protein
VEDGKAVYEDYFGNQLTKGQEPTSTLIDNIVLLIDESIPSDLKDDLAIMLNFDSEEYQSNGFLYKFFDTLAETEGS